MAKSSDQKYDLEERLLQYAAMIIDLVEKLPISRTGNHIASQLLRSGTSPLPNHGEAQAAESSRDFVHKMRICLKELRESQRWLRLMETADLMQSNNHLKRALIETDELIRIFVSSIRTAQRPKNTPR